jgi:hypothetical protein
MRVFKIKGFVRFARKERIDDQMLLEAVAAAAAKPDADLGGGVIKQRIARRNEGKSGGYRVVIFFRKGDRAFFAFGFAKNTRDNLDDDELFVFKKVAPEYLDADATLLQAMIDAGKIVEVITDGKQ